MTGGQRTAPDLPQVNSCLFVCFHVFILLSHLYSCHFFYFLSPTSFQIYILYSHFIYLLSILLRKLLFYLFYPFYQFLSSFLLAFQSTLFSISHLLSLFLSIYLLWTPTGQIFHSSGFPHGSAILFYFQIVKYNLIHEITIGLTNCRSHYFYYFTTLYSFNI